MPLPVRCGLWSWLNYKRFTISASGLPLYSFRADDCWLGVTNSFNQDWVLRALPAGLRSRDAATDLGMLPSSEPDRRIYMMRRDPTCKMPEKWGEFGLDPRFARPESKSPGGVIRRGEAVWR